MEPDHVLKPGMPEYERGQRLRARVISAEPHICIERARLVTEAYLEHGHEDIYTLRAKAFDRVLRGIRVYILDDELIAGHQASRQRSAPLFPEFAVQWIIDELDSLNVRPQDRFVVTDEVKEEFKEVIYPFWKGRTFGDRLQSYLTENIRLQRYAATVFTVGCHEEQGLGHVALDYEKVLRKGLAGIKNEIEERSAVLFIWKPADYKKKLFYESCLTIADSVIAFARRYAARARELAGLEREEGRKRELLRIAANCERVPEHPARTFHEALQSLWFVQLIPQIYDNGVSISDRKSVV